MLKNRKCNYCGNEYYCCKACISINSWKNVCCSVKCYMNMIKTADENKVYGPQEVRQEGDIVRTLLRANLKGKGTIDISGYDLELGKFDCSDGKTRLIDDFEYFIVPCEELKEIITFFNERIKTAENSNTFSKRDKRKDTNTVKVASDEELE